MSSDTQENGATGAAPLITPPWATVAKTEAQAGSNSPATPEAPPAPTPAPTPVPVTTGDVIDVVEPEMVTVTVPKAYKLRITSDLEVQFRAGVQEMRKDYAEHWYSKANGVAIYTPTPAAE